MSLWPHVQYCGQAAVLENSSDAVTLRLLTLIPGLVLFEGYLLARRYQRTRGWRADLLPDAFVPTVAACLFGGLTAGLVLLAAAARPPPPRPAARAASCPRPSSPCWSRSASCPPCAAPCSGTRTADRPRRPISFSL